MDLYCRDLDELPEIREFLRKRLRIDDEHIAICYDQAVNDSQYFIEGMLRGKRYIAGFTVGAFEKKSVSTLCGCGSKIVNGQQHKTKNRIFHNGQLREIYAPFYDMYIFETVSLSHCVLLRCRDCRTKKSILAIARSNVLEKRSTQYKSFLKYVTRDLLWNQIIYKDNPIWPTNHQKFVEYTELTKNMLDQALVTRHSNEQYVSTVCLPLVENVRTRPETLFIQSPCGSGKSKFGVAFICRMVDFKELPDGIFLPVATKAQASAHVSSFKRPYPEWVLGLTHPSRIGILHYKNSEKTVSEGAAAKCRGREVSIGDLSTICTVNSMVQHLTYKDQWGQLKIHVPSFVWIDEIVSVLDAMSMSEHMRSTTGGRVSAIRIFEHIIANCKYLLCTDAFLNTECVQYIQSVRTNRKTEIVQFDSRHRINDVFIYQSKESEFLHHLAESVKQDKKIFVLSDSKSLATKAHNGILEIATDIPDRPVKKFQFYSADTADEIKDHDFANCTDVWVQFDGLFSTPALTTGVDFTTLHFHQCFVFATGKSITARTNMQMIIRVRNYIDKEIHAYLPARQTFTFPLKKEDDAQASVEMIANEDYHRHVNPDIMGIFTINQDNAVVRAPIATLAINYAREHDDSRRDYAAEFAKLSKFCGYKVYLSLPSASTLDEDDECAIKTNRMIMETAHVDKQDNLFNQLAAMHMPDELPEKARNKKLTDEENQILKLYKLRKSIGLDIDTPLTAKFVKEYYDKPRYFSRMRFLGCVSEISPNLENTGYIDDANEPEFYKRLNPSSVYFVMALRKLTRIMTQLDMIDNSSAPIHLDMTPFALRIKVPVKNSDRALPEDIRADIQACYLAYCKQFGKAVTADELNRVREKNDLKWLYSAALKRMGISVREGVRNRNFTYYDLKPSAECELYVTKIATLKKRGKYLQVDMQVLHALAQFTRHAGQHKIHWDSVHGFGSWIEIYETLFEGGVQ